MEKFKFVLLLAVWSAFLVQVQAQVRPHPPISNLAFSQNAWMPDTIGDNTNCSGLNVSPIIKCALGGNLYNNHWVKDIKPSGAQAIRFGGVSVDQNKPTTYQYCKMFDSIVQNGMVPVFEVPYDFDGTQNNYTAHDAANIVRSLNKGSTVRKVMYWLIGNEPNLSRPKGYGLSSSSADLTRMNTYITTYADSMKHVDSTIKIIAPSLNWFDASIMHPLLTVGGSYDITGKIGSHTYCYVDYIDFHTYPFSGNQQFYKQVYGEMTKAGGFRDNLDSLTKWVKTANTSSNRGNLTNNTLKTAVTEINIDYANPVGDNFNGKGALSFVGAHFWAEAMRYCLRDSVSMVNFWSIMEGSNATESLGYLDWSSGAKNATYYHFQELAKNFSGIYLRDTSNKTYLKAVVSKSSNEIHVMVLNEDSTTTFNGYTLYLDWGASTSGNWMKIDAALSGKTYIDSIEALSSTHLTFDLNGNISQKTRYKRSLNNSPPGFHQPNCNANGNFTSQTLLDSYYPSTYSNITIGNGSNIIQLKTTDNSIYKAVNTITIKGSFKVPPGQTMTLLPSSICH